METSCSWLLETLDAGEAYPLRAIYGRHLDRNDSFDLTDVLSFLPEKRLPNFIGLVERRLHPTLSFLQTEHSDDDPEACQGHLATVRAASEISWLLVHHRKQAIPKIRPLIFGLHDAFFDLPSDAQEKISTMCATLWHSGDQERARVVPYTILHFLQRSFGEESGPRNTKNRQQLPGTVADVHRVYAMRKALETLELAETAPDSKTVRNLLMRCATSSVYMRTSQGRKFLAYLLTLNDVKASTFDTLLNHLGTVRKSSANLFGAVFLHAWKFKRDEWLSERLKYLSEKAIQAGSEPFASNLRAVLSTLHANKRVNGVDLLLNNMYRPIIFGKLMVANPLVRRNAVLVLSDAFPIHDPGAGVQDIEETIESQCKRLLDLLQDPCCSVRLAAIEGSCRILGLFWEIVSSSFAKQVVDVLTGQLAFDMSSPRIRMTVCEGLKFLVENHLSHQILSVALRRLGSVVHDRVERVRLAFLDLLLTLKSKRIRSLRYFDVVQVQELLLRLPTESPAVAAKIMGLIRTSYFPLEKKQKSLEELAASQTRACLSMLGTNRDAAHYFYKHLYLHVPPGPLLEFAMRLSHIAVDLNKAASSARKRIKRSRRKKAPGKAKQNQTLQPEEGISIFAGDENVPPANSEQIVRSDKRSNLPDSVDNAVTLESILLTLSEVLVSISTSLRKDSNKPLREYLESIFGGGALQIFLSEEGNSVSVRASTWRIASCLSVTKVKPLVVLWLKQMKSVLDWNTLSSSELQGHRDLLSALLLCGLKWNLSTSLSPLFVSWSEAALRGSRVTGMGTKAIRRSHLKEDIRNLQSNDDTEYAVNTNNDESTRVKFLFPLWLCVDVVLKYQDLYDGFLHVMVTSGPSHEHGESFCILAPLRRACVGALDFFLDKYALSNRPKDGSSPRTPRFFLRALTTAFRACLKYATGFNSDQQLHTEMRQLINWFAVENVWKRAFAVSSQFGSALAAIYLGHAADAVAVARMTTEDIVAFNEIVKQIHQEVVSSSGCEASPLLAEGLRLAFLLREQSGDASSDNSTIGLCKPEKLRETSNSFLSKFSQVFSNMKQQSEQTDAHVYKSSRHESFLRDIMIDIMKSEDFGDFRSAFSDSLVSDFGKEDIAESGIFALSVIKILASLLMSRKESGPDQGLLLYNYVSRCFRHLQVRRTGDQCVANFTKELADFLFSQYSEAGKGRNPSAGARRCFAKMSSALSKEFPELGAASELEAGYTPIAREAHKVLGLLQNMGERDAIEERERLQKNDYVASV